MFFGLWSWILVIIVVATIFYANRLPELRKKAEEKFEESKILFEKSKKELEAKASILAEKAKEKQASKAKNNEQLESDDSEKEITVEDLEFMPKETKKEEALSTKNEAKDNIQDETPALEEPAEDDASVIEDVNFEVEANIIDDQTSETEVTPDPKEETPEEKEEPQEEDKKE